jgi:hypothetical protein
MEIRRTDGEDVIIHLSASVHSKSMLLSLKPGIATVAFFAK